MKRLYISGLIILGLAGLLWIKYTDKENLSSEFLTATTNVPMDIENLKEPAVSSDEEVESEIDNDRGDEFESRIVFNFIGSKEVQQMSDDEIADTIMQIDEHFEKTQIVKQLNNGRADNKMMSEIYALMKLRDDLSVAKMNRFAQRLESEE